MLGSTHLPTLADFAGSDLVVDPREPLGAAVDRFAADATIPGLMFGEGAAVTAVLSRARLMEALRRPFTRELYLRLPTGRFLEQFPGRMLALEAGAPIDEALALALSRPPGETYEPIVCRRETGPRLLDIRGILVAQCEAMGQTMVALEGARAAAESASRAKSAFLANMSHEIRTPLTAILGFAELLSEPGLDDAARASHVQTVRRAGGHLLALINDVLDLAKIEAGQLQVELVRCCPGAVVEEAVALVRGRAVAKGLVLQAHLGDGLDRPVLTDPTRLRQVLVNLVGNAVKFTERGEVHVRAALAAGPAGRMLEVTVEDTGIGLDADALERLFRPFVQADLSTTRRFGGSGLGLVISRQLARKLGGDVTARSTPGEGTSMTVTVAANPAAEAAPGPASAGEASPAAAESSAAGGMALAGVRVLLAEDGLDNQRLIGHLLRRVGAEVRIADNGRLAVEAWQAAAAGPAAFDLVIVDMHMPVMDGPSAARALRGLGWGGPILALTASVLPEERARCLEAGCDEHLCKPISAGALIEACLRRAPARKAAA